MHAMPHLPAGSNVPGSLNVIVEIPKGSQNKYEFDHETGILRLDRVLFSPLHYPGDYGFVPQTLSTDGDPLDALVMVSFPTFPGTVISARPIGVLEMIDGGEQDDKILCVPENDVRFNRMYDITDIDQAILNEIAHFFTVYKHLEGKEVQVIGWKDREEARTIIRESIDRFDTGKA